MLSLLLLFSCVVGAHEERYPKHDRIELSPTKIVLVLDYAVPAGEDARALRRLLGERVGAHLIALATHFVAVWLDGRSVPVRQIAAAIDRGAGRDADPLGVRVTLAAEVALAGRHTLRLADRHKDRRIAVPVTLSVERVRVVGALPPQPFVDGDHPLDFTVESDLK
jgi:hypothetical protein